VCVRERERERERERIHTHTYHIEDPSRQPRLLVCNDGEVECGVGGELTWLEHNGAASGQRLATILKSQCPRILGIIEYCAEDFSNFLPPPSSTWP
jgi:hypothetical protein